jgi:hypothetical protein
MAAGRTKKKTAGSRTTTLVQTRALTLIKFNEYMRELTVKHPSQTIAAAKVKAQNLRADLQALKLNSDEYKCELTRIIEALAAAESGLDVLTLKSEMHLFGYRNER